MTQPDMESKPASDRHGVREPRDHHGPPTARAADAPPREERRMEAASTSHPVARQPKIRALYRTRKKLSPGARAVIRSEGDE